MGARSPQCLPRPGQSPVALLTPPRRGFSPLGHSAPAPLGPGCGVVSVSVGTATLTHPRSSLACGIESQNTHLLLQAAARLGILLNDEQLTCDRAFLKCRPLEQEMPPARRGSEMVRCDAEQLSLPQSCMTVTARDGRSQVSVLETWPLQDPLCPVPMNAANHF